jgi:hypothetical protein
MLVLWAACTLLAAGLVACARAPVPLPEPAPAPAILPPSPGLLGAWPATKAEQTLLACVRQHESRQRYEAVSSNQRYYGAYQFDRETWDGVARRAGRDDLLGILPSQASPAEQDAMALALLRSRGLAPWNGACAKQLP